MQVLKRNDDGIRCWIGRLQFDNDMNIIMSGSGDGTVTVWDMVTYEMINTFKHHSSRITQLRFNNKMIVTSSEDKSIIVYDMKSPKDIKIRYHLKGYNMNVTDVNFDDIYIVSVSDDRIIKIWNTDTGELIRTLKGHTHYIECVHYHNPLIVSGSWDETIRYI